MVARRIKIKVVRSSAHTVDVDVEEVPLALLESDFGGGERAQQAADTGNQLDLIGIKTRAQLDEKLDEITIGVPEGERVTAWCWESQWPDLLRLLQIDTETSVTWRLHDVG